MKVYALGNLRAIHGALIVLISIIIRDFFLDPDVFCKQLRLYQYEACRWISELLLISVVNKEVSIEESRNAKSRDPIRLMQ